MSDNDTVPEIPSEHNDFLAPHIAIIRDCYRHFTGRDLVPPRMTHPEAARYLFEAPLVLLSHDTSANPLFNYANKTALGLFGMNWNEMMACPSRTSVERAGQEARQELMRRVAEQGFVEDYRGVRIGRHGRRFEIEGAVIFNLEDPLGKPYGQAATFKRWTFL